MRAVPDRAPSRLSRWWSVPDTGALPPTLSRRPPSSATEATTLGVRFSRLERRTLARELVTIETRLGAVRVKIARRDGRVTNIAPEYEDCREIALARGVPLKDVYDEAKAVARKAYPADDEPGESLPPAGDRT